MIFKYYKTYSLQGTLLFGFVGLKLQYYNMHRERGHDLVSLYICFLFINRTRRLVEGDSVSVCCEII